MPPDEGSVTLVMRHQELSDALRAGRALPAGRLLGLPELLDDDVWVDTAGAAALARINPKTITGWLTRNGPKRKPFPRPQRLLYRLYWRRSEIEGWLRDGATDLQSSGSVMSTAVPLQVPAGLAEESRE